VKVVREKQDNGSSAFSFVFYYSMEKRVLKSRKVRIRGVNRP